MESLRGLNCCFGSCLEPKNTDSTVVTYQNVWRGRVVSTFYSLRALPSRVYNWTTSFFSTQSTPSVVRKTHTFKLAVRQTTALQFDPTMLRLQQFLVNLSVLMGNSLYTHFVQPVIQNFQNQSPAIQAKLDALANLIATACANEIMAGFDDTLSCTDLRSKAILSWLIQATPSDSLATTLKAKFSDLPSDFINNFVSSIFDKTWLLGSSALNCAKPASSDSSILKTLLTAALQKLINDALCAFFAKVCTILQAMPVSDLPATIAANSQIVGQTIATRFTTLIQTTSPVNPSTEALTLYQQGYDHIVDLVYKQIEAVITTGPDMTKFVQQDVCDPAIRQMLSPPAGTDQATYQTQVEQAVSLQFASDFIPLFHLTLV